LGYLGGSTAEGGAERIGKRERERKEKEERRKRRKRRRKIQGEDRRN
jgi:hypothetical protein